MSSLILITTFIFHHVFSHNTTKMIPHNGKKPVSNLSSALASIHISRNADSFNSNTQLNGHNEHSNNDLMRYEPSSMQDDEDLLYNEQHHEQQYRLPQSIDIPNMRSQADFVNQMPLDRIAQYRKNPPTEGISLFSHRVS